MKSKFYAILANTLRSKIYLDYLIKKNLLPLKLIFLDDKKKNYLKKFLKKKNLNIKYFKTKNINNKKLNNYLINLKERYFLYSGYPGQIIKNKNLLSKKKFLHAHPGKLPEYKGSTTLFYSILKLNKVYCSSIILNNRIDGGKILNIKKFKLKANQFSKLGEYDAKIRILTLYDVLSNLNIGIFNNGIANNSTAKKTYNHYFIAHPIIRYLARRKIY